MRNVRNVFLALGIALFAAAVWPSTASAQYREFTGRIDRIGGDKMIVDNRKGDKVSFMKVESTTVEGEGKKSWGDLKQKDWVTVSWKFVDKPRKAYKIVVIPTPEESGEDE